MKELGQVSDTGFFAGYYGNRFCEHTLLNMIVV